MEYFYDVIIWYNEDQPITEQRTLTIESEIGKCGDTVANPTDNEDAYYFGYSIDGNTMQYQSFCPWLEGYQPMNEGKANEYLGETLTSIINNYWAYAK